MAEFTVPKHGSICWRELASCDVETAKSFYREMFGWGLEESKVAPGEYTEIHFGQRAVGGMIQINEKWGDPMPPSHWSTYIAVDDIAEAVTAITANGGSVKVPPFDAPNVGKIALVSDPAGAPFAVIQFASPAQ
jgi:predicted enzyme related to lactoylglutathione lyase